MEVKDIVKPATLIGEEASLKDALALMISDKTNTLLVIDADGKLSGEVTVADLLDAIVPEYLDGDSIAAHFASEEMFEEAVTTAQDKLVQFFMSQDYSPVEMTDGLMSIAATAIGNQRARIPVIDTDGRPVGIISRQGLKHILAKFLNIKDSA